MDGQNREIISQPASPDELSNGDVSLFDIASASVPRLQVVKPSYSSAISDESLFDLGMLNAGQQPSQSTLPLNVQYITPQQYLLPPAKEESLELEDYIQGLNDRFDLPTDQILPITPRCSFEQAATNLKLVDTSLRTDNSLISNFSPPTQSALLSSPATSDLITPPHGGGQVQDIYTHGVTTTTQLKDIGIPPPFVQKTPMGPVAYNPQLPVFVQGIYPPVTPQQQYQQLQHVQTASMADITSSPLVHLRFPTPPSSRQGDLLHSPTRPQARSKSPPEITSSPARQTSPESDLSVSNSTYGSPQRHSIAIFETPPFSPVFPPRSFAAHLQPRKRGHARGYSTTSIMTTATFATDASSPPSSDDDPSYTHHSQIKSRGTRQSNIPDSTMASYISGPDPKDHKFECLYRGCGKRFGRKYNIQSHIQTHLSDRPYRCDICNAGFVRQHDLRRHEKIHGGDKPFVCACSKNFARQDALTRHRQRGICVGAFPEARVARAAQDSAKKHQRRNSCMI